MIVMRMNTGDNELALAAAGGDAQAFALLIERSYDRLFGLCFRLMGSQAEAEDLCQNICAALSAKLIHFEGASAFSTWLYRVAVNAAHDRRRRAVTRSKAAQGWGDWEVNRTETNKEQAEAQDWLMSAIGTLPDDLRDTVALVMDDMNHRDVGEVLGVSEGTVSWRMSEVKKHLKVIKESEQ